MYNKLNKVKGYKVNIVMFMVLVLILSGCGKEYNYEGSVSEKGGGVIKQTDKKSYVEYIGVYKDYKVLDKYVLIVEFEIDGGTKYFKVSSDTELLNSFHKGKKVKVKVDEYKYIETKAELVE